MSAEKLAKQIGALIERFREAGSTRDIALLHEIVTLRIDYAVWLSKSAGNVAEARRCGLPELWHSFDATITDQSMIKNILAFRNVEQGETPEV